MDSEFWHTRWRENRIGFHETDINPVLTRNWRRLELDKGSRVFVPLCGKSLDMVALRDDGHEIVGIDLSHIAVAAFFEAQSIAAARDRSAGFERYRAPGYELLAGDYFQLDRDVLGEIAAVYDRAALVALPREMRQRYADKLRALLDPGTEMLLVTLQYDTTLLEGPPFRVDDDEVRDLYGSWCQVERLECAPSDLKGHVVDQTALRLTVR